MTQQAEDKIYWGEQLEKLPAIVRIAIISIRLGGQTVIIMALVSVLIAMQLGLVRDQAARDREALLEETRQQSIEIRESHHVIEDELKILEDHVHTTKALALIMCANLNQRTPERNECLSLLRGAR